MNNEWWTCGPRGFPNGRARSIVPLSAVRRTNRAFFQRQGNHKGLPLSAVRRINCETGRLSFAVPNSQLSTRNSFFCIQHLIYRYVFEVFGAQVGAFVA